MAMKTREALFGFHTGIDTRRLFPTSRLLSSITGMPIPRNKAVVGENAFAHESGIHQHGMLKHHSHLRDHAPRGRRPVAHRPGARQAQRPRMRCATASRSWASSSSTPSSHACSRTSSRSPTRRRNCSTATSRRWCCAPSSARAARGTSRPCTPSSDAAGARHGARRAAPRRRPRRSSQEATRRRSGRCRVQGHRGRDRHQRDAAQVRGAQRHRWARTPRARRSSPSSTTAAPTAARASRTDIVESGVRAFLEVVNRIESHARHHGPHGTQSRRRTPPPTTHLIPGLDDRMTAKTLFEKVWERHVVVPETADTPAVLYIDLHLTHEVTSPQAFTVLRSRGLKVRRPDRTLATMDHSTPTDTAQVFGGAPIAHRVGRAADPRARAELRRVRHRPARPAGRRGAASCTSSARNSARRSRARRSSAATATPARTARSARSPSASARPRSATCSPRSACCSASRRRSPSTVARPAARRA